MKTQRQKGNGFERDVVNLFRERFNFEKHECYRTPLSGGHACMMRADVSLTGKAMHLFPFAVECKFYKGWNVGEMASPMTKLVAGWHTQCVSGAVHSKKTCNHEFIPLLICKGNNRVPWAFICTTLCTPKNTEELGNALVQTDEQIHYKHGEHHWVGLPLKTFVDIYGILLDALV